MQKTLVIFGLLFLTNFRKIYMTGQSVIKIKTFLYIYVCFLRRVYREEFILLFKRSAPKASFELSYFNPFQCHTQNTKVIMFKKYLNFLFCSYTF